MTIDFQLCSLLCH